MTQEKLNEEIDKLTAEIENVRRQILIVRNANVDSTIHENLVSPHRIKHSAILDLTNHLSELLQDEHDLVEKNL